MKQKSMASTAKEKSAKIIAITKKIWAKAPKGVTRREGAVIVSMAACLLAAGSIDEIGKCAVQDMAHELSYTWDPFDGFCA